MTDAPRPDMTYAEFLASKARVTPPSGFEPVDLPACLFAYQKDLVTWACRRGKAAVFAGTGTGKTLMLLAWSREVVRETNGMVLVLAPLAVAAQIAAEGSRFGLPCRHVSDQSECTGPGVYVTNYAKAHRFQPEAFVGVVCDEASVMKDFTSKIRNVLVETFRATPFKLACTATPAPNDWTELGNQADFLGVCSRLEFLSEWFTHDGGDTSKWRLKKHAQDEFWKWVCSWAAILRGPEDLGYDGSSHVLPPLSIIEEAVSDDSGFAKERGLLFPMDALSLEEARKARRATMGKRLQRAAEVIMREPGEPWLVWGELNEETENLAKMIPGAVEVRGSDKDDVKEARLLEFVGGKFNVLVSKTSICGHGMNFQHCARMLFIGATFSWERYFQAVRRCWRFGQKRPVHVYIVTSDVERAVLDTLKAKEADAVAMGEQMAANTRAYVQSNVKSLQRETNTYEAAKAISFPAWLNP